MNNLNVKKIISLNDLNKSDLKMFNTIYNAQQDKWIERLQKRMMDNDIDMFVKLSIKDLNWIWGNSDWQTLVRVSWGLQYRFIYGNQSQYMTKATYIDCYRKFVEEKLMDFTRKVE